MAKRETEVYLGAQYIRNVQRDLDKVTKKTKAGLQLVGKNGAEQMEKMAKRNKKWTTRTGDATRALYGDAAWEDKNNLVVTFGFRSDIAPHGRWLEFAMGRRFAIVAPTFNQHAPNIVKDWDKLMRG